MINEYRDEVRGMLFLSNKRPPKKKGGMWSRGRQNRRADAAEASRPAFSFSMRDAGVERGGGGDLGGGDLGCRAEIVREICEMPHMPHIWI